MLKYTSLLAVALALCLTGTSEANGGKGGHGRSAGNGAHHPGNHGYGAGHRNYRGANYRGWTNRYYSSRWRSNFYYNPSDSVWYYWYAPKSVYYPSSMLLTYPPVQNTTEPTVNVAIASGRDVPNLPMPRPR